MPAASPHAYLRTKVLTASPAELRLLLFDGAIKFAEQGKSGLQDKDYEAAYNGISRCQNILMELINALRPEHEPELCDRLSGLYTFMYSQLIKASQEREPAHVEEVIRLLQYERETWTLLIEKLAAENSAAGKMQKTPDASPTLPPNDPGGPRSLVGGNVSVQG